MALTDWSREKGVQHLLGHVHPEHATSEKIDAPSTEGG